MDSAIATRLRAHAEAEAMKNAECVGALFGRGTEVLDVMPLINSAENPERAFELSAAEYLRCEAEAARRGLKVLGFYHSHLDAPAVPSARDLEHAAHFVLLIIVPVHQGVAGLPLSCGRGSG